MGVSRAQGRVQALGEALEGLAAAGEAAQGVQGLQRSLDSHGEAVEQLRGMLQDQAAAPDSQALARCGQALLYPY